MAIATTITEDETKQYMEDVLGDTASKLGWSKTGLDFDEPANEVLYTLGQSSYSFATSQSSVKQVRVTARMEVWRAAMFYTAHEASYSAGAPGTGQTNRGEIHRHAKAMYDLARGEFTEAYPEFAPSDSREVQRWGFGYNYDYYGNAE